MEGAAVSSGAAVLFTSGHMHLTVGEDGPLDGVTSSYTPRRLLDSNAGPVVGLGWVDVTRPDTGVEMSVVGGDEVMAAVLGTSVHMHSGDGGGRT